MSARGPVPKPTHVLKLRGSWRAEKRTGEPQPERGIPTAPPNLTDPQKQIWKRLTRELDSMQVLAKVDAWQLERYCVYLDRWRQCEAFISQNGRTVAVKASATVETATKTAKDGSTTNTRRVKRPANYIGRLTDGKYVVEFREYAEVKESHRLHKALKEIEDRFGLTPAARARLHAPGQGEEEPADPFEDLIRSGATKKKA